MSGKQATLTLGNLVTDFVRRCTQDLVRKDESDVILSVVGINDLRDLFRDIQKVATDEMFTYRGCRRPLRETMMEEKYGFPVVCIESCGEEWLHLGIKTPLGIIPYEL